jgi:AcrR family transcriptional regulator
MSRFNLDDDKMRRPNRSAEAIRSRYHHGDLRAALLTAAEHELADKGIEGFSLRGVAKRAGVSHAAPLHHFRDTRQLLTALAADGFRRFLATQQERRAKSEQDALSQLVASGLGYVDFALSHPALFRLMFSSDRPDHAVPELVAAASAAFDQLVTDVTAARGPGSGGDQRSLMADVMSAWAVAHGLADLMNSGRMKFLLGLKKAERQKLVTEILRRSYAPPQPANKR